DGQAPCGSLKKLWRRKEPMTTKNKGRNKASKLVPYPVIVSAAGGDVDAINAVLKHYEGYIAVLATKKMYDDYGNPYLRVDEGIRRRLETKLITAILRFDAAA